MDARATLYTPRLPLREKQVIGLGLLQDKEAFALLMEPRTGKTPIILAEFGQLEAAGRLDSMLVIAPAGCYRIWEEEAKKHMAPDLFERTLIFVWTPSKSLKFKAELARFLAHSGPRILLVNVEALSQVARYAGDMRDRARRLCIHFLKQRPAMWIVDESTCIKGWDSLRAKFCTAVRHLSKRRRILSGLASPEGPLDLFPQFFFLDPTILQTSNYWTFRSRYAKLERKPFGPRGTFIDVVTGYKNLEQVHHLIEPYSYRVKLEDCYDLPPKIYTRRDVEMTAEQKRIYADLRKFSIAHLEAQETVTATLVIVEMLRLHQVLCGHTVSDTGEPIIIPENRTGELLELLEEYPSDTKVIVWCSYDHDVKKVAAALAKKYDCPNPEFPNRVVSRFWGGNKNTREDEERRFKTFDDCRFMVGTPDAGGKGRNWAVANLNVYYSCKPNLEHRFQSEERPQEEGKPVSVSYVDLICRGSVEEKIIVNLRDKIDFSTTINGDNYREWLI